MKGVAVDEDGSVNVRTKVIDIGSGSSKLESKDVMVQVAHWYLDDRVLDIADNKSGAKWPVDNFPCFVGWEVVGKVTATGTDVTRCKVGDVVLGLCTEMNGGCTSTVILSEHCVVVKPVNLDATYALSLMKPGILAYSCVYHKMHVEPGEVVLITNPSDSLFAQVVVALCTLLGAFVVIVVDTRSAKEKIMQQIGESQMCKVIETEPWTKENQYWQDQVLESLLNETDGIGYDHILLDTEKQAPLQEEQQDEEKEYVPNVDMTDIWVRCIAPHGTIVVQNPNQEISPEQSLQLFLRGATIAYLSEYPWLLSTAKQVRLLHILDNLFIKLDNQTICFQNNEEPKSFTLEDIMKHPHSLVAQLRQSSVLIKTQK